MKVLGILGVIFSSYVLLVCLTILGDEGIWMVFLIAGFFLAQSIVILKSLKK